MNKLLKYVNELDSAGQEVLEIKDVQHRLGEIAYFYSRKMLSSETLLTSSENDVNNIINDTCIHLLTETAEFKVIGASTLKEKMLIKMLESIDTLSEF